MSTNSYVHSQLSFITQHTYVCTHLLARALEKSAISRALGMGVDDGVHPITSKSHNTVRSITKILKLEVGLKHKSSVDQVW